MAVEGIVTIPKTISPRSVSDITQATLFLMRLAITRSYINVFARSHTLLKGCPSQSSSSLLWYDFAAEPIPEPRFRNLNRPPPYFVYDFVL